VALMMAGKGSRNTALPFGSFLAPAGLFVYVFGSEILGWYVRTTFPARFAP